MANTQVFQIPKAHFTITAGESELKVFTKESDFGRVSSAQARQACESI